MDSAGGGLFDEVRQLDPLCRRRAPRRLPSRGWPCAAPCSGAWSRSAGAGAMPMSHGSVTGRMSISTSPRSLACRVAHAIASSSERVRTMLKPAGSSWPPSKGPLRGLLAACGKPESHALGARAKTFPASKRTRLRQRDEQRSHTRNQLRARDRARLPVGVGLVHDDESHASVSARRRVSGENSTTAGVRTSGFTLCVCPASSR